MADESVYIGIDIAAGKRPVTCAVLSDKLKPTKLEDMSLAEAVDTVLSYQTVICAVDAPISQNKGLLATPDYRERIGLPPNQQNYSSYRVCEYELRRRGIYIYNTPSERSDASDWMQAGWEFYERLRGAGFVEYPRPGTRRVLETYPYASYYVLTGTRPYHKMSVEGRAQRQLVLYEEGVEVPDPMQILEEWTRHRLLTGQLNLENIHGHDQLDALIAAYTAYLVEKEPQHITAVGDIAEGQVILPTGELKESY